MTFFICCLMSTAVLFIRTARAEDDLTTLRIAATIALEAGSSGAKYQTPMENVARVIQVRHTQYTGSQPTWTEILYGNKYWFERSRGFASKTPEELKTYIQNKAGTNWQHAIRLAQQVKSHSLAPLTYNGKVANGFMRNYSGSLGPKLFTDAVGHDFYNTYLGSIHVAAFKKGKEDLKGLSENSVRQSTDWNVPEIDRLINKGSNGKISDGAGDYQYSTGGGGGGQSGGSGGSYSGGNSGGGGGRHATYEKPEGYDDRGLCALDVMSDLYLNDDVEESKACWYCNVVVILANAYLKAAAGALPSAITLGEIILKFGFLIWLAYYILQQVSSFTPITPSKVLQEILVMGFKVALAYLGVKYAESVIVEYYVNPIGQLGTEYGGAMFDKLYPTNAVQ